MRRVENFDVNITIIDSNAFNGLAIDKNEGLNGVHHLSPEFTDDEAFSPMGKYD